MGFAIRELRQSDVPNAIAIERACFTSPWNENIFRVLGNWGGRIQIANGVVVLARVMECEATIVGYVIWEEDHKKRSGHLLNLAVDVNHRRKGLGTRLAVHALETMKSAGFGSCKLEVRESNMEAIHLYEKLGFHQIRKESDYYPDEDALIYVITF